MDKFTIVMLGGRGAGKTTLLASMFNKLSLVGEFDFFLKSDDPESEKELVKKYQEYAYNRKWLGGSVGVSEWNFTCYAQTKEGRDYPACQFTYLDFAGGKLTEMAVDGEDNSYFYKKLEEADTILGILDGKKLHYLMKGESGGETLVSEDLPLMLPRMQQQGQNPVHFVISKWDVLKDEFSLEDIRAKLLAIPQFKNFVQGRIRKGAPVRLIPVSAVGMGFAELQPDGNMAIKPGAFPNPFQVELPLAYVLPDKVYAELSKRKNEANRLRNDNNVVGAPTLSLWETMGELLGEGLEFAKGLIQDLLPSRYRNISKSVIEKMIEVVETGAKQKREDTVKLAEVLSRQKEESLEAIKDEATALDYAIRAFLEIQNSANEKLRLDEGL